MSKLFTFICAVLLISACTEQEIRIDEEGNHIPSGVKMISEDGVDRLRYKDHYYLYIAPILGHHS